MTPKNILPFPILEINALIVSLLHWPLQVKPRLSIHTWFLCISPSSFIIILLLSWADFSYADVESFYALFILPSCQNHTLMGSSPTQISSNIPKQEAMAFYVQFSSVQSLSCVWLWPHESQHARPPCRSPTPRVYSNSCPSSRWCHPAISSSVVPFSSCPQSLLASGSFPMSQLFAWGGQSTGVSVSASVLPMNTREWSPLGWTGWIQSLAAQGTLKSLLFWTP